MGVAGLDQEVLGSIPSAGALSVGWVAVVALAFLATALRFWRLAHQGFWFDEANTALLVHLSPGHMLGLLPKTESTPPLYYCLAWVWARIFGFGEAGLRSLSAAAGVLTVPVAYAAGTKLVSRRAGLIVAALVTTSPLLVWYSQEARSYALVALLGATTLLAFAYALATPTPRALAAWTVACALALATHYFAVVAVAPEAVWLLAVHRRGRAIQAAVGAVGLAGLALIPLALSQEGTGNSSWIAHIPLHVRVSQIIPQFLLGFGAPAGRWLRALDAVVVAGAIALLVWRGGGRERAAARLAGGLAVAGAAVMVLFMVAEDDLVTRNVILLWLPLALVVAAGLASPRAGRLGLAGAAVLCASGVIATVGIGLTRNLQRPDWRAVAAAVGLAPPGGGRAIVIQRYRTLLPLSLYLPHLSFVRGDAAVRVDELDVIAISSPREDACWWGAACNLIPSQVQRSYPIPGFREVDEDHVLQFTVVELKSKAPVELSRAMVSRALTGTRLRRDGLILQSPAGAQSPRQA